jgi:hypothetical protein
MTDNRPKYRSSWRGPRATIVYTIAQESKYACSSLRSARSVSIPLYLIDSSCSRYLIVRKVPAINVVQEATKLFEQFGPVLEYATMHAQTLARTPTNHIYNTALHRCRILENEECSDFTHVYWIKYQSIDDARSVVAASSASSSRFLILLYLHTDMQNASSTSISSLVTT